MLGSIGELHRPRALFAGVDLKITGSVIPPREAVLGAANSEFLFPRAHIGFTRPFAAAVIVDRIDIIITRDEGPSQQRFTRTGRDVPPALGGPSFVVFVPDGDADPAARIIA